MIASYIRRGRGKSLRAIYAEEEGRYPKTHAAKALGLSLATFNRAIEEGAISTKEWHHTGKYANRTDYWDTREVAIPLVVWLKKQAKAIPSKLHELARDVARESLEDRLQHWCPHRVKVHNGKRVYRNTWLYSYETFKPVSPFYKELDTAKKEVHEKCVADHTFSIHADNIDVDKLPEGTYNVTRSKRGNTYWLERIGRRERVDVFIKRYPKYIQEHL